MTLQEEQRLRELAITDWERFKAVTNIDLTTVEICLRRSKGKSIRQIARDMKISRAKVEVRCRRCE